MGAGVRALRAKAVEFLFVHIYKSPPRTEWRQLNVVPTIMRSLQISDNCSLSSIYAIGDPRRFSMGTPDEVWSSMRRCWQVEPTSERIIEDVQALPEVLQRIITAKGCVLQDQYLRNGRRARRADDKGECKNKPVKKQRTSTNTARPLHPDCEEAFNKISGAALATLNINLDIQAEYVELIEAANIGSDDSIIVHVDEADEIFID